MRKYLINTPIKVKKNTILKPGGEPVELSDKIVNSLPSSAITAVEVPDAKPDPKKTNPKKTDDGKGQK